jgi:hypothetical protein
MTARETVVAIQRSLVGHIKREIYHEVAHETPGMQQYFSEYQQATSHYERLSNKRELVERMAASDLVFIGDFHTLRPSQKIPVKLIQTVLETEEFKASRRMVVIGLEMFFPYDNDLIGRYMKGELADSGFLEAVNYEQSWGFNWNNYKAILDFARKAGIKVVGVNAKATGRRHLWKHDHLVARAIADVLAENPGCLLVVQFGDLHLAPQHLPSTALRECTARGLTPKMVLVHQNSDRIYWKLAASGLEQIVDVVKVDDLSFCVMNSTPLIKYQSWLNWQHRHSELLCPMHADWCEIGDEDADMEGQVKQYARAICKTLGLPAHDMSSLSVYTTHDLHFLESLKGKEITAREAEEIRTHVLKTESYFIAGVDMVCLTNLSVNHAAEEAAHYLHSRFSGWSVEPRALRVVDERKSGDMFYSKVMREALGYFGSKLINHRRLAYMEQDYHDLLEKCESRRLLGVRERELRDIARLVVEHRRRETLYKLTGKWKHMRVLWNLSTALCIGLSHALGYMLGERLHSAMMQEFMKVGELRALFMDSYQEKGEGLAMYLSLQKRLEFVQDLYTRKAERL